LPRDQCGWSNYRNLLAEFDLLTYYYTKNPGVVETTDVIAMLRVVRELRMKSYLDKQKEVL
jgi:hypothetical protein